MEGTHVSSVSHGHADYDDKKMSTHGGEKSGKSKHAAVKKVQDDHGKKFSAIA